MHGTSSPLSKTDIGYLPRLLKTLPVLLRHTFVETLRFCSGCARSVAVTPTASDGDCPASAPRWRGWDCSLRSTDRHRRSLLETRPAFSSTRSRQPQDSEYSTCHWTRFLAVRRKYKVGRRQFRVQRRRQGFFSGVCPILSSSGVCPSNFYPGGRHSWACFDMECVFFKARA